MIFITITLQTHNLKPWWTLVMITQTVLKQTINGQSVQARWLPISLSKIKKWKLTTELKFASRFHATGQGGLCREQRPIELQSEEWACLQEASFKTSSFGRFEGFRVWEDVCRLGQTARERERWFVFGVVLRYLRFTRREGRLWNMLKGRCLEKNIYKIL